MANRFGALLRPFTPSSTEQVVGSHKEAQELYEVSVRHDAAAWKEGAVPPEQNVAASSASESSESDHLLANSAAEKISAEPKNLSCKGFMVQPSVLARLGISTLGIATTAVSTYVLTQHTASSHSEGTTQIASLIGIFCGALAFAVPAGRVVKDGGTVFVKDRS